MGQSDTHLYQMEFLPLPCTETSFPDLWIKDHPKLHSTTSDLAEVWGGGREGVEGSLVGQQAVNHMSYCLIGIIIYWTTKYSF